MPWLSPITALLAPDRSTNNVSGVSTKVSPVTVTFTGWVVVPGGNVSTPLLVM